MLWYMLKGSSNIFVVFSCRSLTLSLLFFIRSLFLCLFVCLCPPLSISLHLQWRIWFVQVSFPWRKWPCTFRVLVRVWEKERVTHISSSVFSFLCAAKQMVEIHVNKGPQKPDHDHSYGLINITPNSSPIISAENAQGLGPINGKYSATITCRKVIRSRHMKTALWMN